MANKPDQRAAMKKAFEAIKDGFTPEAGEKILKSWFALEPQGTGIEQPLKDQFGWFAENAPDILWYCCTALLAQSATEGALDAKTRELVILGICAWSGEGPGLIFHIPAALAQGCTPEEVIDAIRCGCYEFGKIGVAQLGPGIAEGFKMAAKAGVYKPKK